MGIKRSSGVLRTVFTAFAFCFGIFVHAAEPSPCGSAEDAYAFDADGNIVEAANDIAYDNAGRLSIQGEGFA